MSEAAAVQTVNEDSVQQIGVADLSDEFIHEAFIAPIRNMVVLDDEYATLEELACIAEQSSSLDSLESIKKQNLERVRSLVRLARSHNQKKRPWLIDINNTVESDVYGHLRNSDLLILDYHLNGDGGGPEAAIKILQDLAANDDFNMVVIYTKGEQGSIEDVVRQIIVSLTHVDLPDFSVSDYENKLSDWDDLNDGVYDAIVSDIKPFVYAKAKSEESKLEKILQYGECTHLNSIVNENRRQFNLNNGEFTLWALHKLNGNSIFSSQFSDRDLGSVSFGIQNNSNWIRTKSVFITVVDKRFVDPDDLESKLIDAIKMSKPTPHQFLLSKMRSVLMEKGVVAEMEIIGNKSLQRMWLKDFVGEEASDEMSTIDSVIKRHWESLGNGIYGPISDYAKKIRAHLKSIGNAEIKSCYNIDLANIGINEKSDFNCYSNLRSFDRGHLTTGHILAIRKMNIPEYWICLSPACDMAPRGPNLLPENPDLLPFVAVKLHGTSLENAMRKATENHFVFLPENPGMVSGGVNAYSINKGGESNAKPVWQRMYLTNKGYFAENKTIKVGEICFSGEESHFKWHESEVLFQLRAEYALNLLQKFGNNISRAGLGINFQNHA